MIATAEQVAARDAFATGGSLVIEAGAGTGKTSTLVLLAEATPRSGQYLAFNKALVLDATGKDAKGKQVHPARFPERVKAQTVHSLAWWAIVNGTPLKARLDESRRMSSMDIARILRIDPIEVGTGAGSDRRRLSPGWLAGRVIEAVDRFCQSADEAPGRQHFAYVEGLDLPTEDGRRGYSANNEIQHYLLPFLTRAWLDLCGSRGSLRFLHSHYLKLAQLQGMRIPADYVMVDESQDIAPVMRSIVEQQDVQTVWVGDSNQEIYCQPIGTLVDVPARPRVFPVAKQCRLVNCERGRDHIDSGLCDRHEQQSRQGIPADEVRRQSRFAGVEQVPIESLAIGDLVTTYYNGNVYKRGRPITGIVRKHHTGRLIRVATPDGYSSAYTPEHHCIVRIDAELRSKHIVYLMRRGDQFRIGRVPVAYASQGGGFGLKMRATAEGADAAWILSVHDTAPEALLAEYLTQHTFNIPGVRFRPMVADVMDVNLFWGKVGANGGEAEACLTHFGRLLAFPLWQAGTARVGTRRPFTVAAANLVSGMSVLTTGSEIQFQGKQDYAAPSRCWQPATVTEEWYDGEVVSLEVSDHHTYYGDGVMTHNSWTGAQNALAQVTAEHRCFLSQSFRFGPAIAAVANAVLGQLLAELRLTGMESIDSRVILPEDGPDGAVADCILSRTNACSVRHVIAERAKGRRVHLVGDGREVLAFARAAQELMTTGHTGHRELSCFADWPAVQAYTIADALGGELRLLVQLVDEFGTAGIEKALAHMPKETDAEVIVSTAHKAKGREWRRVKLADDFPSPKDGGQLDPAELRLLYVAATRAKHVLDLTACPSLAAIVAPTT